MFTFALDNQIPATIVLLSGDGDFTRSLSLLQQRKYRTVVIHPTKFNQALLAHASHSYHWADLAGIESENDMTTTSEPEPEPEPEPETVPPVDNSPQDKAGKKTSELIATFPSEAFESLIRLLEAYLISSRGGVWLEAHKLAAMLALYDPSTLAYLTKHRRPYFQRARQLGIIVFNRAWTKGDPNLRVDISLHPTYLKYPAPESIRRAAQNQDQEDDEDRSESSSDDFPPPTDCQQLPQTTSSAQASENGPSPPDKTAKSASVEEPPFVDYLGILRRVTQSEGKRSDTTDDADSNVVEVEKQASTIA